MEIYGWGRYPRIDAAVVLPKSEDAFIDYLQHTQSKPLITRGLGRSYGDSSLSSTVLDTQYLNHFQSFDETTGLLTCEAGVSLSQVLEVFVPRGWFLPVTPGTRFVTVGGAIASDVHGKNHHVSGTFCEHVTQMEMLLGNGEKITTSPTQHPELFHATCGGMGLTGIILSASIRLVAIKSSEIIQTTIKAPNLIAVLEAFEDHQDATYSVAWINCLATGKDLGRSLLMLGEHAQEGPLVTQNKKIIPIPADMPAFLLNQTTISAFNALYYNKTLQAKSTRHIAYEPFFYPLDALANWNRLYGKSGFVQYQFVLPKLSGEIGLREILERIANSGKGSFLAILKVFGKANQNLLSFPMEGYTLALDFKVEPNLFGLLNGLDKLVLKYGGRLYLTKDARMSESTFKLNYPRWSEFETLRMQYHAIGKFSSHQSQRLGLL
jgi:FAD/FMN-containing dehydrogenase